MDVKEIDMNDLKTGIILKNDYQDKKYYNPILKDGLVYKFFVGEKKDLMVLLLKVKKLNLETLAKINSFFGINGNIKGYCYEYDSNPLLKDALNSKLELEKRLVYIEELIKTTETLRDNNLIYWDFHSCNFTIGDKINFLDVDGISNYDPTSSEAYFQNVLLFQLMISIFFNTDLTLIKNSQDIFRLLANYFSLNEIDAKVDVHKVFAEMQKKREIEIEDVKSKVLVLANA